MLRTITFLFAAILFAFSVRGQDWRVETDRDSLLHYLKQERSSAHADAGIEVFYEIGSVSELQGTGISYKYEIAFKVYDKEEAGAYLDIVIPKGRRGIVKRIEAVTYNLENDVVQESKLNKTDILLDDYSDNLDLVKFNIPGVKNGSIVRYQYVSEGYYRSTWNFQREDVPVMYSRFNFDLRAVSLITSEVNSSVNFRSYDSKKKFERSNDPAASLNSLSDHGGIVYRSWIMRNVTPYIHEPNSGFSNQHIDRVKVYYNGYSGGGYHYPIVDTWEKYNEKAWYKGIFQSAFKGARSLNNIGNDILSDTKDSLEIAKKLYYLVQGNIKKSGRSVDVNDMWSVKQGNSPSISMFLCALYRSKGFQSDLVLLANKGSDKLNPLLYNVDDITNCVVRVIVGNRAYLLEPAEQHYPFAYLPTHYYNGYARIVNEKGGEIDLPAYLAQEVNTSTVVIRPDSAASGIFNVTIKNKLGVYAALNIRRQWETDSIAFKSQFVKKAADLTKTEGFLVKNVVLEHYEDLDQRLELIIEGQVNMGASDMIIYDPFFYKFMAENPLKDAKSRKYPVELDYVSQDRYILQFDLGDEYEVDEMPQNKNIAFGSPALVKFTQNAVYNESTHSVMLAYKYDNSAVFFSQEDAADLQDYYAEIIKNFNQKLIIKRKK